MVSSLTGEDSASEADSIGAKAFLYKPVNRAKLLKALESAME